MADETLLEVSDVETSYGLSRVLFGISFKIAPGEMVSLMGRNGMGKTTTVRSIMGLTAPAAGSIRLSGTELRGLPAYRIAKLGIGLVPEGRQVFPNLTARENLLATAANRNGIADPWSIEKIFALFPRLAERAGAMANLLSGGEQQMLAIGRALMSKPSLLLVDEPSIGLAPIMMEAVMEALRRLRQDQNLSIMLVEQRIQDVLDFCDRVYILSRGRIVESMPARSALTREAIEAAYFERR
jgi:branched-chain amino acid transport system ATP-binding protein